MCASTRRTATCRPTDIEVEDERVEVLATLAQLLDVAGGQRDLELLGAVWLWLPTDGFDDRDGVAEDVCQRFLTDRGEVEKSSNVSWLKTGA